MANIDLFVCITNWTSDYAELTKKMSSKLLSGKHNIKWKFIISGEAERNPDGYEYIATTEKHPCSSMAHGIAVNKAFSMAEENYVIMLDADVVFLHDNWDDIIVKELDSGYAGFGLDSPKELDRWKNFPFMYCFCYRKDLLNGVELDFRPYLNEKGDIIQESKIETKYEEDVTKIKIGRNFKKETSCRLPFIFYDNNLKANAVPCVLPESNEVQLPFIDDKSKRDFLKKIKKSFTLREYMEEWHYKGKLFASHLRRSKKCRFEEYHAQHWVQRMELYLRRS